jgi:hypothetical protein
VPWARVGGDRVSRDSSSEWVRDYGVSGVRRGRADFEHFQYFWYEFYRAYELHRVELDPIPSFNSKVGQTAQFQESKGIPPNSDQTNRH